MCIQNMFLNSTIVANIKVCSIQMQCAIEALMCIFKTTWTTCKFRSTRFMSTYNRFHVCTVFPTPSANCGK